MNVIREDVGPGTRRPIGLSTLLCAILSACATGSTANAPPAVAEECRREVADIMDTEPAPPLDEVLREDRGPTDTAIDDAREAREERQNPPLADWPEDALLYRCFISRGVVLTAEQAATLAEWQGRGDGGPSVPPPPTN